MSVNDATCSRLVAVLLLVTSLLRCAVAEVHASSRGSQHFSLRRGEQADDQIRGARWVRGAASRHRNGGRRGLLAAATAAGSATGAADGGAPRRGLAARMAPAPSGGIVNMTGHHSTPATDVLKPGELPPGNFVPIVNLTYRLSGRGVLPVTPALVAAVDRTFDSVFALFDFSINVTVTPAVPAPVYPLESHSTQGAPARTPASRQRPPPPLATATRGRRLLQAALHMNASSIARYAAVDATIVAGFTAASTFLTVALQGQSDQRVVLQNALRTVGIDGNVIETSLNSGALIDYNLAIVTARLPSYYSFLNESTFTVLLSFDGPGVAPISITTQTVIQLAVADATPLLITCGIQRINTTTDNMHSVIKLAVSTAHVRGSYHAEALQELLQSTLGTRIAKAGLNVQLLVTVQFVPIPAGLERGDPTTGASLFKSVPLSQFGIVDDDPEAQASSGDSSSSLSAGEIAGVVLAAAFAALCVAALIVAHARVRQRQRRDASNADSRDEGGLGGFDEKLQGFLIAPDEIEVCTRPDGTEWLLGERAFGELLRGVRGGVQDVAVKRLLCSANGKLQQFIEEVGMLKGLNYDRNIVQFYGACIRPGARPMLISEFMEGGDLGAAIEHDRTGELRWYCRGHRIALDIARGLYFLHSHDVQHGALSSACVLLTSSLQAKIGDVGIAQLAERIDTVNQDHDSDAPPYSAPESLLGRRSSWRQNTSNPGLPADIYSFGVVLLEIVTGIMPKASGQAAPPLVPDECPPDMWQLIQSCTASQPAERPTAKVCFDALRASVEASVAAGKITLAASVREHAQSRTSPPQPPPSGIHNSVPSRLRTRSGLTAPSTGPDGAAEVGTRAGSTPQFRRHSGTAGSVADGSGTTVLRMASGAATNEALLSQLNKVRSNLRRDTAGDSSSADSGSSNPLAAGSAAAIMSDAANANSTMLHQPSLQGQQPPPAANPAARVQQRQPSTAWSGNGTSMYGVFEDAAWLAPASGAGTGGAVVPETAPGGTVDTTAAQAYLMNPFAAVAPPPACSMNPFAAVAGQQQWRGTEEQRVKQEASEAQQPAISAVDSPGKRLPLNSCELNDTAFGPRGSLYAKAHDLLELETADSASIPVTATPAAAKAARRKPSPMHDYYSAFRSRHSIDGGGALATGRYGVVDPEALDVDPAKLAAEAAEIQEFARASEAASSAPSYGHASSRTRSTRSAMSFRSQASGNLSSMADAIAAHRTAFCGPDGATKQPSAAGSDLYGRFMEEGPAEMVAQPASPFADPYLDLYATFADSRHGSGVQAAAPPAEESSLSGSSSLVLTLQEQEQQQQQWPKLASEGADPTTFGIPGQFERHLPQPHRSLQDVGRANSSFMLNKQHDSGCKEDGLSCGGYAAGIRTSRWQLLRTHVRHLLDAQSGTISWK